MAERPRSGAGVVMRLLMVLLLLGIAWRVLSLGMADANRLAPEQALQWRPQHSSALFLLAEQQAKNPASFEAAKKNAAAALQAYPFETRAYRVLAQVAEAENKPELAFTLYQDAVRYGPRDLASHLWLLNYSLRTENADAAVHHLDQLLRMQIDLLPPLIPLIGGLAVRKTSQTALISSLAKNPAWRIPAIKTLLAEKGAGTQYAEFFGLLAKAKGGVSEPEQQAWLKALNQDEQWSLAYLNWASQLAPEKQLQLGNLFNGDFEHQPLGSEFDWQFGRIPGATIDLAFRPGVTGQSGLRVRFDDRRVPFANVQQTLVLPPGRYRLLGRGYADDLRTELGLVWSVQCLGSGIGLASSEPWKGRSEQWQAFSMDFEVPVNQCLAQWIVLKLPARVPSEQAIGGSVWFDDLKIQRIQALAEH